MTVLASVAGQTLTEVAAHLVVAKATVLTRLLVDHTLVDVELAVGPGPPRAARAVVGGWRGLRADALVEARRLRADVYDYFAVGARPTVQTRARVA